MVTTCHHCAINNDLADQATCVKIFDRTDGLRCGLLAGFPCQPWCSIGYGRAFDDQRALTFLHTLDGPWLFQSEWLLFECTCGAGQNAKVVKDILDQYCAARSFHWRSITLHLENACPCKRKRWWALLLPRHLVLPNLTDLPILEDQRKINDFLQCWPKWPWHEEEQLDVELQAFEQYGSDANFLRMGGSSPTLLRSMGYQVLDCPCKCRGPLSSTLLAAQGLHGTAWPPHPLGHPHPREASWLVALPGTLVLHHDHNW